MIPFQRHALLLVTIWIVAVAVRFRRSTVFLVGGLIAVGTYTAVALLHGSVSVQSLGLSVARSWAWTIGIGAGWLVLMLAYSPVADWIAARIVSAPPALGAFRGLKESRSKLVAGIAVAWILGGLLEEVVFRGIVLQSIQAMLSPWIAAPAAVGVAVLGAAAAAGVMHLYQGPRAALIITQLSVMFGALFVASGYDLWAVVLCHGFYDTIAFIRFASGKSRYSKFGGDPQLGGGEVPAQRAT
jgi:membrane protease YdiL (CAAX protease family)